MSKLSAKEREWKLEGALEFQQAETKRLRDALEETTRTLRALRRGCGEAQTDQQRAAVAELERVTRVGESALGWASREAVGEVRRG